MLWYFLSFSQIFHLQILIFSQSKNVQSTNINKWIIYELFSFLLFGGRWRQSIGDESIDLPKMSWVEEAFSLQDCSCVQLNGKRFSCLLLFVFENGFGNFSTLYNLNSFFRFLFSFTSHSEGEWCEKFHFSWRKA